MKRIYLPLLILIQLLLAGSLMSQTIITLTFTASTNGHHQPLDSVVVENLTQGGDTVLHYPDTVLLLDHGTAVSEPYSNHNEGLILYPAFPNPFTGQTTTRFFLPERDQVTIRVFDLLGRELTTYQQTLPAGEHTFTFYPGSERYYLLVVQTPRDKRVQKLISLGGTGACRIAHSGSQQGGSGFRKGKSGFPWAPGDQLQFTGYATLTGNIQAIDTLADDPLVSSLYTFQFLPPVPTPVADFSVSDTLVYVNDVVHFTDLSTGSPTTWKWFFGDGDSSLIQNPSHIYTTIGLYSVTLIVSNAGGTDTLTRYGHITVDSIGTYPPGYVHCDTANPTAVVDVTNPITGKIWMDRNLGASQAATSSTDAAAYGDLYQWGRFADGHQCRTSATTSTLSTTHQPGHGNFITSANWINPSNHFLWQGVVGVNNPCPTGYRLPTEAELNGEQNSWSSNSAAGAFASPLKLTVAGYRDSRFSNGSILNAASFGYNWSSTVNGVYFQYLNFRSSSADVHSYSRAYGLSVRCIKD